jgi:hypothetical protein
MGGILIFIVENNALHLHHRFSISILYRLDLIWLEYQVENENILPWPYLLADARDYRRLTLERTQIVQMLSFNSFLSLKFSFFSHDWPVIYLPIVCSFSWWMGRRLGTVPVYFHQPLVNDLEQLHYACDWYAGTGGGLYRWERLLSVHFRHYKERRNDWTGQITLHYSKRR